MDGAKCTGDLMKDFFMFRFFYRIPEGGGSKGRGFPNIP